ncbi:MAG: TlpA family protein disulfide reductase [Acidobacteria bacterium]|nr:TlpA family protein disulfide reductase [Acidobacteriota bacterium]MBI3655775.1 TlpA family protein disulfide reductase [Acidobacteriota bacterium]
MNKGWLLKFGIFGLVITAAVVLISFGKRGSADRGTERVRAWDFTLLDMQNQPIKLSDYRNKVIFVNFWASWDVHWHEEVPIFNALYEKYRDRGFEIISISLDDGGTNDIKPELERMKVNYKVVMGNESVSADYRIRKIPTTFIIDREGIIRKHYVGILSKAELELDIKTLLYEVPEGGLSLRE